MLRRLVMDRKLERGLPWLVAVLANYGVTRLSDLSKAQSVAIVEERADAEGVR